MKRLLLVILMALGASGAQAALVGRDINGNAVAGGDASSVFLYDTVLNITWLRNANVNGLMNWTTANTWAANLVVGAFDDWRLPTMTNPDTTLGYAGGTDYGYNVRTKSGNATQYEAGQTVYSEMAHLFYVTLNSYVGLYQTGDFLLVPHRDIWFGLEYAPDPTMVWDFNPADGSQGGPTAKTNHLHAMAVRDGDVLAPSAVPLPSTAWLTLAGIGALGIAARRRKTLVVQS